MAVATHTESAPYSATRVAWEDAYATYRARKLLDDADVKFGALHAAEGEWALIEADMRNEYGSAWRSVPEANTAADAVFDKLSDAEKENWTRFGAPLDAATRELLLADAPDLDAVQVKADILSQLLFTRDELGRLREEIIADDVARLTGIVA